MDSANYGSEGVFYGSFTAATTTALLVGRKDSEQRGINIRNTDLTNIVYLGSDALVTTSNGYPLNPGDAIFINTRSPIYGLTNAGTSDCRYIAEAA